MCSVNPLKPYRHCDVSDVSVIYSIHMGGSAAAAHRSGDVARGDTEGGGGGEGHLLHGTDIWNGERTQL